MRRGHSAEGLQMPPKVPSTPSRHPPVPRGLEHPRRHRSLGSRRGLGSRPGLPALPPFPEGKSRKRGRAAGCRGHLGQRFPAGPCTGSPQSWRITVPSLQSRSDGARPGKGEKKNKLKKNP